MEGLLFLCCSVRHHQPASRNVPPGDSSSGWSPLGKATKIDVVVHPNWTNSAAGTKGKPAADAAIIITSEAVGRKLGWLDYRFPPIEYSAAALNRSTAHQPMAPGPETSAGTAATAATAASTAPQVPEVPSGVMPGSSTSWPLLQQQQQLLREAAQRPPTASAMEDLVSAAGLSLHVVGYPDNKPNGSMWEQCCSKVDWQLQVSFQGMAYQLLT